MRTCLCIEYLSGPVGSVSCTMDTTWAVISWSVPSYIPSDYPIITYEVGYHILVDRLCCSIVNDNDIDIQILQLSNSTSGSTFINITGLNDKSCYIFCVRAYTDKGPGNWRVIANETLISTQFVTLTLVHVLTSTSTSTSTQQVCIGSTNTGIIVYTWQIFRIPNHFYYFNNSVRSC